MNTKPSGIHLDTFLVSKRIPSHHMGNVLNTKPSGIHLDTKNLKKVSKRIPNRRIGGQICHTGSAETSIKKCRLALSCYAVKIKEVFFNIISNFF